MFSRDEKIKIAKAVEKVIREIDHPEMDNNNIRFQLHVQGKSDWNYADIHEVREGVEPKTSGWNEKGSRASYAKKDTKETN